MRERPLLSLVASLLAVAALHNGRLGVCGRGVCSNSVASAENVCIIERRTSEVQGDVVYRHVVTVAFVWLVASVECELELRRIEGGTYNRD